MRAPIPAINAPDTYVCVEAAPVKTAELDVVVFEEFVLALAVVVAVVIVGV